MEFLIGVIILIVFIIFCYLFIKSKIKSFKNKYFNGMDFKEIMEEARIEDEELPKSLSSMDSVYLEQIKKDFPDCNINELKRVSEALIFSFFKAVEDKDITLLNNKNEKIKEYCLKLINDNKGKDVKYRDLKIHKTVLSKYEKAKGIATIYFSSSFQYEYVEDGKSKKVQDRAKVEFIYVIDSNLVAESKKALGINCPNCGSPIKSLGEAKCSYCGTNAILLIKKVWTCNDFFRY